MPPFTDCFWDPRRRALTLGPNIMWLRYMAYVLLLPAALDLASADAGCTWATDRCQGVAPYNVSVTTAEAACFEEDLEETGCVAAGCSWRNLPGFPPNPHEEICLPVGFTACDYARAALSGVCRNSTEEASCESQATQDQMNTYEPLYMTGVDCSSTIDGAATASAPHGRILAAAAAGVAAVTAFY